MRNIYLYIINAITVCCFLSCTDEGLNIPSEEQGIFSVNATLKLGFDEMPKYQSRAGEDTDREVYVDDLHVFAFNSSGTFEKVWDFTYKSPNKSNEVILDGILSGNKYIYGVANLNNANFEGSLKLLKEIAEQGKEAFLNAVLTFSQNTESMLDGLCVMSGSYISADGSSNICNVPNTNAEISGVIQLIRVQSQIQFIVKTASTYKDNKTAIQFTPKTWQVCNLPKSSYLFEKSVDYNEGYKGNEDYNIEDYYFDTDLYTYKSGVNTVTYYMMENRKSIVNDISLFRERKDKAPSDATYMVITGKYVGPADQYENNQKYETDEDGNQTENTPTTAYQTEANVTYYIPLGYVNGLTDYSIRRNSKYTYTITIKGIDDIVLEVVDESERTSVEDGDVIYTSKGRIVELDAHYANGVLCFTREMLENAATDNVSYYVKTPYTDGYEHQDDTHPNDVDDDWVSFKLHSKSNNRYNTSLIPYPGNENESLLHVQELIAILKDAKINSNSTYYDNDGNIYFTCYVNEYYYQDKEATWWTFTDKPNREMLLLCDTYGPINESTITDATYIISQKSIQTIFKTDGTMQKAWGTEWINESINIHPNYGKNKEDWNTSDNNNTNTFATRNNDGRRNMIQEVTNEGNDWDDINTWNWDWDTETITQWTANNSSSATNYNKAYLACMSRNRDNDGDGNIDSDEIRWYLASVNQYQDLWVGSEGIDPDAQLYKFPDPAYAVHYFSNSKGQIFFAEEGAAVSPYHEHGGRYSLNNPNSFGTRDDGNRIHAIRCLRNLNTEFITNENDVLTVDYASVTGSVTEGFKFSVDGLNDKSLRSVRVNSLTNHYERDESNKVYVKGVTFHSQLTSNYYNNRNENWDNLILIPKDGTLSCPEGYRIPNQRELILLNTKLSGGDAIINFKDQPILSNTVSSYYLGNISSDTQRNANRGHPLNYFVGGYCLHNYNNVYTCVLVTGGADRNDFKIRCVRDND